MNYPIIERTISTILLKRAMGSEFGVSDGRHCILLLIQLDNRKNILLFLKKAGMKNLLRMLKNMMQFDC